MTSLSHYRNEERDLCLSERIHGAAAVIVFGAIVALNTVSVVLALLAA